MGYFANFHFSTEAGNIPLQLRIFQDDNLNEIKLEVFYVLWIRYAQYLPQDADVRRLQILDRVGVVQNFDRFVAQIFPGHIPFRLNFLGNNEG
ncbi:MAG: hypothetical protein H7A36_02195 [Chlamydiales bacterium]|nr:hypothetical protein [Chlamydiales bacterium]